MTYTHIHTLYMHIHVNTFGRALERMYNRRPGIWNVNNGKDSFFCLGCHHEIVGNKAKGHISKRVFQENKARQIFRKTNISYPLIRTRTCAYQGVRNVRFSKNLACFVFLKHPSRDSPFCLITDEIKLLEHLSFNNW